MKRNELFCLLFSILPFFVNGNIWDNLFLGQGIAFKLPSNFSMELSLTQTIGKLKFEVVGSSDLNCVSIKQGFGLNGILGGWVAQELADYKFNFTNATLYVHSPLKECIAIKDDKFKVKFYPLIQGYIDVATLLLSKEREGDYYKLSTNSFVQMVNTTEKIPDITFYFDTTYENLKKIEVKFPDYQDFVFDVVSIEEYDPSPNEFSIPEDWHCQNEKAKTLEELDPEELRDEVMKSNSPLLSFLKFLPTNFTLPKLPNT